MSRSKSNDEAEISQGDVSLPPRLLFFLLPGRLHLNRHDRAAGGRPRCQCCRCRRRRLCRQAERHLGAVDGSQAATASAARRTAGTTQRSRSGGRRRGSGRAPSQAPPSDHVAKEHDGRRPQASVGCRPSGSAPKADRGRGCVQVWTTVFTFPAIVKGPVCHISFFYELALLKA